MMGVDKLVEWKLAGETEVLREHSLVSLCRPQIPHNLSRRGGKPATKGLSNGAAQLVVR
jgi:hypothetical protein